MPCFGAIPLPPRHCVPALASTLCIDQSYVNILPAEPSASGSLESFGDYAMRYVANSGTSAALTAFRFDDLILASERKIGPKITKPLPPAPGSRCASSYS